MTKQTVSNIFNEKNELLRGRDSFFSGEPGDVVVSKFVSKLEGFSFSCLET